MEYFSDSGNKNIISTTITLRFTNLPAPPPKMIGLLPVTLSKDTFFLTKAHSMYVKLTLQTEGYYNTGKIEEINK